MLYVMVVLLLIKEWSVWIIWSGCVIFFEGWFGIFVCFDNFVCNCFNIVFDFVFNISFGNFFVMLFIVKVILLINLCFGW